MTDTFYLKQNDLLPALQVQLLDNATPVDLTNATSVYLRMSNRRIGLKVDAPMTIANQTTSLGVVSYHWATGDTDTVGEFNAEFRVNWPSSKPQTFPASNYVTVIIQKGLAA